MRLHIRLLLSILAITCAGLKTPAVDVYNTLAQPSAGTNSVSTQYGDGLSFKTTATDYVIDSVQIPLMNSNATSSGSVTISIYDANGTSSRPGSIVGSSIGSVAVSSLTNNFQTFTFSGLNRTLSPSTNYYIVIRSANITSGTVRTDLTTDNTGAITTGSLGDAFYNNGWTGPFAGFWVRGSVSTVAVPEPSTYVLAAIATGVLGFAARRRKR